LWLAELLARLETMAAMATQPVASGQAVAVVVLPLLAMLALAELAEAMEPVAEAAEHPQIPLAIPAEAATGLAATHSLSLTLNATHRSHRRWLHR